MMKMVILDSLAFLAVLVAVSVGSGILRQWPWSRAVEHVLFCLPLLLIWLACRAAAWHFMPGARPLWVALLAVVAAIPISAWLFTKVVELAPDVLSVSRLVVIGTLGIAGLAWATGMTIWRSVQHQPGGDA